MLNSLPFYKKATAQAFLIGCTAFYLSAACTAANIQELEQEAINDQQERSVLVTPKNSPESHEWVAHLGTEVMRFYETNGEAGQNRLISPLSLSGALLLAAQGASATTAKEYAAAFGLGVDDLATAQAYITKLNAEFNQNPAYAQATAVFLATDFLVKEDYAIENRFFTDFTSIEALNQINSWFAEQTAGNIDSLIDDLPSDTRFVLGDALHFESAWLDPFDPELTRSGVFTDVQDQPHEVDFLSYQNKELPYFSNENLALINLPFLARGFELILIKDLSNGALPASGLLQEALAVSPSDFAIKRGNLFLPKVDLHAGGDVTDALKSLGLLQSNDYGRLSDEPVIIDQVVHKTALKWDEQGAEASAATAVLGTRSMTPLHFNHRFDRPFAFILRHQPSGLPLFIGTINQP